MLMVPSVPVKDTRPHCFTIVKVVGEKLSDFDTP